MQARARIARFLHRELGFSVLAFESSLFICHLADLRAATRDPQRTLSSSVIGVWHTAEMLPLFEYLHETRASSSVLRLAGFDVQPIGGNRKQRPAFFSNLVAAIDPEYATTVQALDTEFLAAYDAGGSERRAYLRAHVDRLAAQYEALASFIERHISALQQSAGREAPLVAAQEARSAAAYIRFQTAPDMRAYTERRDRGMFENLRFLAERLFPSQKIIVWGHNYHLRHENEAIPAVTEIFPGVAAHTMGTWTREHFGRRVFTIGEYAFEGEAVDNSRTPYTIARAAEGSLEQRLLEATGGAASIVELAGAAAPPWARTVLSARYNGQQEQMLTPAAQYDAILFLPRVSPPRFLY
jgi:erythromycin esterase